MKPNTTHAYGNTMQDKTVRFAVLAFGLALIAAGCCCAGAPSVRPEQPPPSPTVSPVAYEVHEWGVLRGTADDRVLLSGPHVELPPMPMAKPVLYIHRQGDGPLVIDVRADVVGGRVVEHWPSPGGEPGSYASWSRVMVQEGSCRGSRYPSLGDDPCTHVRDGCEASSLSFVETDDSDCLFWPTSEHDGPTQAWNHLFYRGEISSPPALPLQVSGLPDGSLSVQLQGTEPIPGQLVRVRRANGVAGLSDAVTVVEPPDPGMGLVVPPPSASLEEGRQALSSSLRAVGLTPSEVSAFERAWNDALFGRASVTTTIPTGSPMPLPRPTTSLLYLLPAGAIDRYSRLTLSPPPAAVHRAMVVWVAETAP